MSVGRPLGTIVAVDDRTVLVTGQELIIERQQPDVGNALLHRVDDTLFMIDTGVTETFRAALLDAVDRVGPWQRLVILTTHGHLDHVGNNDLADELAGRRGITAEHYYPAGDHDQLADPHDYWRASFAQLTGVVPLPGPPDVVAATITSWFTPFHPFATVSRTYETLPLHPLAIGSHRTVGWSFADGAVQVLPSQGHCAGHVIVHLRDAALLHLGDESNGPCALMLGADQAKVTHTLFAAGTMIETAGIQTVTDGHRPGPLPGTEARRVLQTMVEQGTALHNHTRDRLDGVTRVDLRDFLPTFGQDVRSAGLGGPNPNPVFTGRLAVQLLRSLGYQPQRQPGVWSRPQAAFTPTTPTRGALSMAKAGPGLLWWRLRGRHH